MASGYNACLAEEKAAFAHLWAGLTGFWRGADGHIGHGKSQNRSHVE